MRNLTDHADAINRLLSRYGVKFGIYKNQTFHEQLFPFDAIPRIISCEEFALLERGLIQRVDALNLFLADIYHEKRIVRDGVLPSEFLYASKGYLPECEGCKLRQQCGGLFASNQKHHSAHINPNLEDITASACVE